MHVSLAATMLWIRRLGTLDPRTAFGAGRPLPPYAVSPLDPEIAALCTTVDVVQRDAGSPQRLTAVRHSAVLGKTRVREGRAPVRLDAHEPVWLDRTLGG